MSNGFRNRYKFANKDRYYQSYNKGGLSKNISGEDKILTTNVIDGELKCWLTNKPYQQIRGEYLYQRMTCFGEGEIHRHLCGNGKCINPIHLRLGTDIENAYDELEVRSYMIKRLQEQLEEDYSNLPPDVAILVLVPRMARTMKGEMNDTKNVRIALRDEYREVKELELYNKYSSCTEREDWIAFANEKMDILERDYGMLIVGRMANRARR